MVIQAGLLRLAGALLLLAGSACCAQDLPLTQQLTINQISPLDPARAVKTPVLESSLHTPLPEQYIWTAADAVTNSKLIYTFPKVTEQTEPHFFRAHFTLRNVPRNATLYLAGPRMVEVWINGALAGRVESDVTHPLGMHVFSMPVAALLRPGDNTVAIKAVRGRGVTGFANSLVVKQQTFGQVLVAKIVPAAANLDQPAILKSDTSWRSSTEAPPGWETIGFDDHSWRPVQSLGGIESTIEMFQWNADAGLYDWPGYDGISPFLAHMRVPATGILATYAAAGSFDHLDALTGAAGDFTVHLARPRLTDADAASIVLDFGRELTGRLELVSDSDSPATVTVQLGESESETMKVPFLGVNQLTIAAHGTGHSPKTAFRYARIRFLGDATLLRFKSIAVDHVYDPVDYAGSFESSDPLLNRMWEVGAYTAHLCMQDGVWDASKRDRGRWMGDMDVSGRTIEDVFGERTLMEDTLDRLLGPAPVEDQVNGIPGYSAFWFTGMADFYRHTGDHAFLEREHERMVQLLGVVDREFDERSVYANKAKVWLYVDWSPDLNGDTPETRRATTLEFYRGYRDAVFLLRELGDTANATKYEKRADEIKAGAEQYLKTGSTFGPRWQTNAAAVIGGAADPADFPAIWSQVLAQVGSSAGGGAGSRGFILSPYYNYYVIRAMAMLGHRQEALSWIRQYWGGMLQEGATSFWEAFDPSWYKEDFHSSLQSDNRSGYFVSLAHGWSTGPVPWLMEQVLGIEPTGAGFNTVDMRPDLLDLTYAKGAEPTPHGLLAVDARRDGTAMKVSITLPEHVVARVSVPAKSEVKVNGRVMDSTSSEAGTRRIVTLAAPGIYTVTGR